MKIPCKLRKAGWKLAPQYGSPHDLSMDARVDVIFWNGIVSASDQAVSTWAWGWSEPRGYRIRYWRHAKVTSR